MSPRVVLSYIDKINGEKKEVRKEDSTRESFAPVEFKLFICKPYRMGYYPINGYCYGSIFGLFSYYFTDL